MAIGRKGISLSDGLLYGLIAVVIGLSLYAVVQSMTVQQRVATTFVGWYEDKKGYDKAMADQKATGKPALVYFYATWCPHCKQFAAQVLSAKEMQQFVQNYPHVRVAPDNGEAEKELMRQYGAQGYPSFYVVMPNGTRKLVETYTEGANARLKTPGEFVKSILKATGGQ